MSIPAAALEAIIEASGIAPRIEALLPAGVRCRQLKASTLILGMMLALADRRPAHLTEVHAALTALPRADQVRLGVTEQWKNGPHQLTYRQAERTFGLITAALEKQKPDGIPSTALTTVLEASIPGEYKTTRVAGYITSWRPFVGAGAGGRVRPGGSDRRRAGWAGAGEEPAVGRWRAGTGGRPRHGPHGAGWACRAGGSRPAGGGVCGQPGKGVVDQRGLLIPGPQS